MAGDAGLACGTSFDFASACTERCEAQFAMGCRTGGDCEADCTGPLLDIYEEDLAAARALGCEDEFLAYECCGWELADPCVIDTIPGCENVSRALDACEAR